MRQVLVVLHKAQVAQLHHKSARLPVANYWALVLLSALLQGSQHAE